MNSRGQQATLLEIGKLYTYSILYDKYDETAHPMKFAKVQNGIIQNNIGYMTRWTQDLTTVPYLLYLAPLPYSASTMSETMSPDALKTTMATSLVMGWKAASISLIEARRELKNTGEIWGGVFLAGTQQVWISHYDQLHMELREGFGE
jgi:hypothetical protein